jgi:hypothetical protein
MCDLRNYPSSAAPGQEYALPIEAVAQNRIRIQPDRASLNFPETSGNLLVFRGFRVPLVYSNTMGGSYFEEKLHS